MFFWKWNTPLILFITLYLCDYVKYGIFPFRYNLGKICFHLFPWGQNFKIWSLTPSTSAFLFWGEHSPKIADLHAHNASQRDALWACRSAIFGEESWDRWKSNSSTVQLRSVLLSIEGLMWFNWSDIDEFHYKYSEAPLDLCQGTLGCPGTHFGNPWFKVTFRLRCPFRHMSLSAARRSRGRLRRPPATFLRPSATHGQGTA